MLFYPSCLSLAESIHIHPLLDSPLTCCRKPERGLQCFLEHTPAFGQQGICPGPHAYVMHHRAHCCKRRCPFPVSLSCASSGREPPVLFSSLPELKHISGHHPPHLLSIRWTAVSQPPGSNWCYPPPPPPLFLFSTEQVAEKTTPIPFITMEGRHLNPSTFSNAYFSLSSQPTCVWISQFLSHLLQREGTKS